MKNRVKNFFPSLPIFLTSLSFFAVTVATAQIPSSGLVGYWNFSGNVNDASSNGNNGIMQPGNNGSINFVTDRFGNSNSAIEFTSNPTFSSLGPYIEIPNSQNLLVNSDFTMSYSIKVSAQNVIGEIINKGADAIANSYFSRVANGILQNSIPTSGIINVSNFPIGSWQTVTITYSNSLLSYYLNGVFQQSVASGPIQSSSSKYYFGSMVSGSTNGSYYPFQGIMDDISIYNRALTPAEITQVYTSQTSTVQPPCPTLATNLQTGLVGYWPFCGNANDESGNGNNGTVNGATLTTDRFGNTNSAYSFDGLDDCIDIGTSSSLDFGSSQILTVNYWVQASNGADYRTVISRYYQGVANNSSYGLNYGGDNIGVYGNGTVAWMVINSPTGVNWNEITIVMNKSAGTAQIYKNGIFVTSGNVNYNSGISSVITSIGRMYAGSPGSPNSNHFNGKIDDISIYNRALTPAEITQLYTDQTSTVATPPCPTLATNLQTGLVGYWPFCGNANDESGNGNNGTVNGATLTTDRFGNANSAYSFDGVNDYILTNSFNLNLNSTVSFWIKASNTIDLSAATTQSNSGATILSKGASNSPCNYSDFAFGYKSGNYGNGEQNCSNINWFETELGSGCNLNYVSNCNSNMQLDNNWQQITIKFKANRIVRYLNGAIVDSIADTFSSLSNSGFPFSIGARYVANMPGLTLGHWKGEIDDICVWSRLLNSNEIAQNFTPGIVPCTPFLGEDQTVCAGTSVTLEAGQSSYSIGQTGPAGGIIFHTQQNPNGVTQVFEAAPSDIGNVMWGCAGFVMNQTSAAIGSGQQNTNAIISACGNSTAAALCANYTLNGADDWYLPSINELGLVFQNLWANGMGNFNAPNGQYWSSTENSSAGSMIVSIAGALPPNFVVGDDNKNWTDYIRPCRSFTVANNTYLWSTGSTTATINVTPTTTTTYTCTVTDANGNVCTDSVTVFVPQIEATDLTICAGETTTLSVSGINSTATPSACPTLPTNLQTGLVGYWPFCGNANDASGNGNNGTVNGSQLTNDSFGNLNSAYSFNTNSHIYVPFSSSLNTIQSGLTMSSWIYMDGGTGSGTPPRILELRGGYGGGGNAGFVMLSQGNSNTTRTFEVRWYNNNGNTNISVSPTFPVSALSWHHVAFSCDGLTGIGKFYLDGVLLNTNASQANQGLISSCNYNNNGLFIGAEPNLLGKWGGKIDELVLHNRALSAIEIQQLFQMNSNSYLWSNGATTPTINVSPTSTTTYTCTVTTNGVSCTDDITVVVNQPVASITPNGIVEICQGQSIALTGNGGVSYLWNTGAPTQSITVNTEAVYSVTVTDANGCTDTESQLVKVNFLPNIGVNNASICSGQSATLTATGGLTYVWSPATGLSSTTGTTVTASPSTSTVYTVTGTGANGCTNTATAAVAVNALPTATITPATATTFCQGGSVVLNANTGTGLTYQWRLNGTNITGATSSSYTANASGSYTVVVTNTSTCSATSTATVVTVNALPTATITAATATTFCQGGSVVLNANTGTGLTYQWRLNGTNITGATSSSYTANASGSYTVVVTNASTCSSTSAATVVTVNAIPTATITASSATTFCQGGSVVLTANTGTGLSYQWFNNAAAIGGGTSSSYTANASGSYTVIVTNAATCSATSTATVVTVNALPTATITASSATTFCQGGSVVLTANTGTGLTYQWRLNGTNITGATSSSYTANASGSYTVVVTNASTCSSTSAATVVTVNALPTSTITPATATTFCQGGSVVLNANTGTGLSYQWFNNAVAIGGATSSSYTANTSGSYTVVVTNASTCSSTSAATVVTVNALPTATITASSATTFCQGGSVVLTANTGTGLTYQWRLNGTNITGATSSSYTANASGSYTVVVTNTSACSATSTATVVTVNALPTATITASSATTFCQGGSVVLTANTGTGLTYQWRLNGTNITGATSSSYTANASGSYTVVVTNTSTCSATSTATVVTVNALPTATITPATATTFCQGGSVVLNANTGTGLTYQWRLNGTNITGATSSSYTANASGSYTVVVTNTSTCSATSTATIVTVNALPTATITPATATTFCQGGSVVLNANTGTGLTYQWRLNGTNITGATTSSYTANASGSYTVVVTNTSTCSATSTATVVTVNSLPSATITAATATTFCQGASVVLNANTGAGLTYQWRLNGNPIGGATSASYTANASGSYTVVVTNTSTCSATSTAIDVTSVPNVDYFADADGDGFGDVTTLVSTCVQPQGYVTDNTDCKDNAAAIYPGAQEICNDVDDDCNDLIDDGLVFITYYADVDGDTFGDANNPLDACLIPDGYVTDNTDCNDNNANQSVASIEICNGEDDDCDGTIDNGLIFLDYYADLDSDGFGAGAATNSCVDLGAGYVTNNTDCNNANALINPNATEICNDIDDNCDGQIDEGIVFTTYYQDFDNDGFGTGDAVTSCTNPGAGWVTNNTDCDDTNGNTNPNATETCNTIDDNCDSQIDEGVQTVYFIDNDGDTYGNPSVSILACTQPIGYTPDDTDCNDTDANINPGAEDIGGNGIDENCDGEIDNSIFELNATISLYPNPTRSELNIQVNSSIIGNDLYIFDAVGKLVHKQQLLSTQTILPVSNFADGNYVVKVGEVVKRFVVQK